MNVEEVKVAVQRGAAAAGHAMATIIEARDLGRDAGVLAGSTCHDSRNRHVLSGHARSSEADHEVRVVLERLRTGTTAANAYLEAIA